MILGVLHASQVRFFPRAMWTSARAAHFNVSQGGLRPGGCYPSQMAVLRSASTPMPTTRSACRRITTRTELRIYASSISLTSGEFRASCRREDIMQSAGQFTAPLKSMSYTGSRRRVQMQSEWRRTLDAHSRTLAALDCSSAGPSL